MGMSSSQARLLHLTARMHQIEHRAQKIQADKLRLANESDRVYNDYLEALDAVKLQYRAIANDGSTTFRDATLNAMENGLVESWSGDTSNEVLFMQGVNDGNIYVTPAVAQKYGLSTHEASNLTMDEYLIQNGFQKTKDEITEYKFVGYDTDKVKSFTPVGLSSTPPVEADPIYAPVDNEIGSTEVNYKDFQLQNVKTHPIDTSSLQEFDSSVVLSYSGSGTYKISSVESFMALNKALSKNTDSNNYTYVLANDLDFSGVPTSAYRNVTLNGTFDGNGYTIKNLTINNTGPQTLTYTYDYQYNDDGTIATNDDGTKKYKIKSSEYSRSGATGLFGNNNGTIKNLGLDNMKITSDTNYNLTITYSYPDPDKSESFTQDSYIMETACLVGYNYSNGVISNCWVSGTVNINDVPNDNRTHSGGICSTNTGTIEYCSADVKVNNPGGQCVGGISGHNDGTLNSCWVTGTVNTCIWGGGLVGHNDGTTTITDCITTAKVTGTSCIGAVVGCTTYASIDNTDMANQSLWTIKEGYDISDPEEKLNKIKEKLTIDNIVYDPTINPSLTKIGDCADIGTDDTFKTLVTTPSVDATDNYKGGFWSNVYGALVKSGVTKSNIDENAITNYVKKLYESDNGGVKIANINSQLFKYIKTGTCATGFIDALKSDIQHNTISATTSTGSPFQSEFSVSQYKSVVPTDTSDAWDPFINPGEKGTVTAPSINTIAKELYYALKIQNPETTQTESSILSWLTTNYDTSSNQDKIYLANIAQKIFNKENLNDIFSAIGSSKYKNETYYKEKDYNASLRGDENVEAAYEEKYEDVPTGNYNEYWDTSDPDIANAIMMWTLSKRGIVIVTDDQAKSQEFITNYIKEGVAVLTTFNPENVSKIQSMSSDEIMSMSDSEYNELMGIENTSVAVNTHVREVSDEKNLKKAEAQYEADMRRINQKDTKYDTELAICENERNALKEEMESLKTVIKDNVDRTFKLFS